MLSASLAASVDSGHFDLIVTSGSRLSRAIERHVAQQALARGATAWQAPPVLPWRAWLRRLAAERLLVAADSGDAQRLLTPAAARALWREATTGVLRSRGPASSRSQGLAALAEAAYALMRRYDLGLEQVADQAFDDDSRFFVDCTRAVQRRLRENGWLLESDLPEALARAGAALAPTIGARVLLAGFDVLTPDQQLLTAALAPVRFDLAEDSPESATPALVSCNTFRDEIVAAGRWARGLRAARPECRIAVVVPGLAGVAEAVGQWFRQGFLPPGAGSSHAARDRAGFELSYGKPLREYPAVATALGLLEFALRPRSFVELSRLLRSPVLSRPGDPRPVLLEQRLRERPDRPWGAADLSAFAEALAPAWLAPVATLGDMADARREPAEWAEAIADMLTEAGWLEPVATDSPVYQLRRAFHVALNALGTLGTTAGRITLAEAVAALAEVLSDAVYQPEGEAPDVLVCGPLEMPGLGFDAVWVAGLDASRWPAPGRANPLLPRNLQREHGLPDATPEQTEAFWRQRFHALTAAAPEQVLSHARREADSELLRSPLLGSLKTTTAPELADGRLGWFELAGKLTVERSPARLSSFSTSRRIYRASQALALLDTDPFAAMALGRWHVDALEDPGREIGPRLRGNLVHAALETLYGRLDGRDAIVALDRAARERLVRETLAGTMAREFVHADEVTRTLLRIEEARAAALIDALLDADADRPPFEIIAREQARTLVLSGLTLHLRLDRVDRTVQGSVIIDYKTGQKLSLTTENVLGAHLQMLLYALTESEPVAGIALAGLNRDAHRYSGLVDEGAADVLPAHKQVRRIDMAEQVSEWRETATGLAARFLMAPVDIGRHPVMPELNWLSRHAEATRDAD